MPVPLNAKMTGPLGGFGWLLRFDAGGPRSLMLDHIQVPHDTKLLLTVAGARDVLPPYSPQVLAAVEA